jgi:hypothetical protein
LTRLLVFLTRPVQPFMATGAQGNQVQIVI